MLKYKLYWYNIITKDSPIKLQWWCFCNPFYFVHVWCSNISCFITHNYTYCTTTVYTNVSIGSAAAWEGKKFSVEFCPKFVSCEQSSSKEDLRCRKAYVSLFVKNWRSISAQSEPWIEKWINPFLSSPYIGKKKTMGEDYSIMCIVDGILLSLHHKFFTQNYQIFYKKNWSIWGLISNIYWGKIGISEFNI